MKFLQADTPVGRMLARLLDLMLLNIVWLICCIPVITIGASTTAMYDVAMKLYLNNEEGIFIDFFRAFKKHFLKATGLYLIIAGFGAFIAIDLWCAVHMAGPLKFVMTVVILAVGYFFMATVTHAGPVLAYWELSFGKTIKYAFIHAMRMGLQTILIMLMDLLPFLLLVFNQGLFIKSFFIWMTAGFAIIAYIKCALILLKIDPEAVSKAHEDEEIVQD